MFRFLSLLLWFTLTSCAPTEDLVDNLPGLEFPVSYKQYSGYLNGNDERHLHYWFIESQNDATTDPLVLWLNGGPGCSSLLGLLTENGPFSVSAEEPMLLVPNLFSWNQIANILYLESPACVGFSYDSNNKCYTGDKEVAEQNMNALEHFFKKFPEFAKRDFYITGESYGGIYVPTLAKKFYHHSTYGKNLKGFAIGNGLLNYSSNDHSLYFFGYHHGLIGEEDWTNLMSSCCKNYSLTAAKDCPFDTNNHGCAKAVSKMTFILNDNSLNIYDLYGKCEHTGKTSLPLTNRYNVDKQNLFQQFRNPHRILHGDPPCTDNEKERNYMNNRKVRAALHVPKFVPYWDVCNMKVNALYHREVYSSAPIIKELVDNKVRGLIYNGDVDMACNFIGNEWDIFRLGFKRREKRRKWLVHHQVAGYVDRLDGLDFITVRGSGHMVPESKPAEALHMIKAFINKEKY